MTTQTHAEQATDPTSLAAANRQAPVQRLEAPAPAPNHTGLPNHLKAGVESLSGLDLSDVRVNYNSTKPAQLQAHAYTQGNHIHVGPGQEQHLAHEAWHVVQQKQGRVAPTMQFKGTNINHDRGLEQEADVMGARAMRFRGTTPTQGTETKAQATCTTCGAPAGSCGHAPVQAVGWDDWAARLGVGLGALGAGAGFMAAAPAVLAGGVTAGALGATYMAYRRYGPGRNLGEAGEQIAPGDRKLLPLKKHLAKERERVKHNARPKLGGRNKL
ncbi:MAG: DUF4157 domain-containing protein, partial [Bacteroidota bacterium]